MLIGLFGIERRPARGDEPTSASSVLDQAGSAADQTTGKLNRVQSVFLKTQDVLSKGLKGQGAAKPVEPAPQAPLEDIEVDEFRSVAVNPKTALAGDLFSAEATILGPDQIETGEGGEYRLSVPTTKLVWKVYPTRMILRQDNGRLIFFAGKVERTYTLLAVYLDPSGELSEAEKIVTVGAPTPPIPPTPPTPPGPKPPDPPTPPPVVPVYPVPSAEMQGIVGPVKAVMAAADATDKRDLAKFFQQFADVVLADSGGVIKTTAQLRTANSQAGNLAFGTRFKGKYPGLKEALEAATSGALGLENRNIDAALRTRAVETFKSLAWAVGT